jgi:hypothetical protein
MGAGRDEHIYVGRLEGGAQAVYAVGPDSVERLTPPLEGFGWGPDAVGMPGALAHALLADATGARPDDLAARHFAGHVLARLPHDGFALPRRTVDAWVRRTLAPQH